jgi:hypothetical protein
MVRVVTLLLALTFVPDLWGGATDDKPKSDDKAKSEKPATAQERYQALSAEVKKAEKEVRSKLLAAHKEEERQKIEEAFFAAMREKFIPKFLSLAEEFPTSEQAFDSLQTVLQFTPEGPNADKAVDLLLKHHVAKLGPLCQQFGSTGTPAAEKLLRGIIDSKPTPALAAQASLGLAQLLKTKSEADGTKPAEAEKLTKEAQELCATIIKKYADDKDVTEPAKGLLFELRNLAIGKQAPEITGEDADGKSFKLTDYRGKVVVIDFWAEW